jgi:hypothetical protein
VKVHYTEAGIRDEQRGLLLLGSIPGRLIQVDGTEGKGSDSQRRAPDVNEEQRGQSTTVD